MKTETEKENTPITLPRRARESSKRDYGRLLILAGSRGYTGAPKTVLMTAVKSRQISELKQLVQCIDPNAFMIVQPAHQVLGEGFKRYNDDI